MRGAEDDVERLVRLLSEDRDGILQSLASGTPPADTSPRSYTALAGQIQGINRAIERVRDVFKLDPPEPYVDPRPLPRDY